MRNNVMCFCFYCRLCFQDIQSFTEFQRLLSIHNNLLVTFLMTNFNSPTGNLLLLLILAIFVKLLAPFILDARILMSLSLFICREEKEQREVLYMFVRCSQFQQKKRIGVVVHNNNHIYPTKEIYS